MKKQRMSYSQSYIDKGYKEILLPAGNFNENWGQPLMSVNHLHIWPHHDFMLIALPNQVSLQKDTSLFLYYRFL